MKRCSMCGTFHWGKPSFCKSCGIAFDEQAAKQQTQPQPAGNQPIITENLQLAMLFEDVFVISGRGTLVTGFSQSDIAVGDVLVNQAGTKKCTVMDIEVFRAKATAVPPRTNCGLYLSNFTKEDFVKNEPFFKLK